MPSHRPGSTAALLAGGTLVVWSFCLCGSGVGAEGESVFRRGDWPFRPPQRPAVPDVQDRQWVVNPIDAFVLAELESTGLAPSSAADKLTLLRRVTFDLAGLAPTPAEQDAFLADSSPGAYERVVDRLLASPAYGERWSRHWLDLVRYAETDGFKADDHRPDAYRYRDYVVRALNADLPYNRFIAQQLAGDELEPENPEALVATGLNRLYPDEYNAANLEQRRQEILDDITAVTGSVFLGLTVGCAQCHDHKFDDVTQADYYRLQAFFAPLAPHDAALASAAERQAHGQRQAAWEAATAGIRAEMESLLAGPREELRRYALTKFRPEIQEAVATAPEERTPYQQQIAAMALRQAVAKEEEAAGKLTDDQRQRLKALQQQLSEFDSLRPAPLPGVMAAGDVGVIAPATHRLEGGNWRKPAETVEPGFPAFLAAEALAGQPAEIAPPPTGVESTGRRSALARWLTRPDHPLTARVMVNRLWQHHFGLGIVPTPNDFGAQGEAPSHPPLLDWLAVELVEQGWRLKPMHRLMVTSAAYRQRSRVDPLDSNHRAALERDPDNKLLWRARRRRLEGETLRDSMLAVSGELNRRMFGPSARPQLPEGLSKNYAWPPDALERDRNRRSIYVLARRNLRYPLFDAFDLPDMHQSCARRSTTITAPQALLLLNGEFALEQAASWASRLLSATGAQESQVVITAWRQALGRPPTAEEASAAIGFLRSQAATIAADPTAADPQREALADLCHALLNANEFIYVD